jgi:hypothetical protein
MTTIFDSARPVKSAQPFRRGIDRQCLTHFEPSEEDRAWAAALFEELDQARYQAEKDRELEAQALQARWDDQFRFPAGVCESCGKPSDWLDPIHKLCGECLTAAENATIACMNRNAMGQDRVF